MKSNPQYILAIDQGTTGTTVVVLNDRCRVVGKTYKEIKQYYPEPSWVEHSPTEIWEGTLALMKEAVLNAKLHFNDIAAIKAHRRLHPPGYPRS